MKLKKEILHFLKTSKCSLAKMIAKKKLESCEESLVNIVNESNAKKIKEYIRDVEDDDGGFSQVKLWKLKQTLFNKEENIPTAKRDKEGNLITSASALKNLYTDVYFERLSEKNMKPEYKDIEEMKKQLWNFRKEMIVNKQSEDWSKQDLAEAIKKLKNKKF